MDDLEFRKLDVTSRIAPGSASWPISEHLHWTHLTSAVKEARERLLQYREQCSEIDSDPRLTATGKKQEKKKAAEKALAGFAGSKAFSRAQGSVTSLLKRWEDQVLAALKPASTEGEATLHAEIRRHVASLKGAERMAFLEKHAADPVLAISLLEAPQFLTGCTDAELTMVRRNVEAQVLPPEVAKVKPHVEDAMHETAHGWERAQVLIAEDVGLNRNADGSWGAQPVQVDADAHAA